jgi:hypothetical protein
MCSTGYWLQNEVLYVEFELKIAEIWVIIKSGQVSDGFEFFQSYSMLDIYVPLVIRLLRFKTTPKIWNFDVVLPCCIHYKNLLKLLKMNIFAH